jgi:hypothetical protein
MGSGVNKLERLTIGDGLRRNTTIDRPPTACGDTADRPNSSTATTTTTTITNTATPTARSSQPEETTLMGQNKCEDREGKEEEVLPIESAPQGICSLYLSTWRYMECIASHNVQTAEVQAAPEQDIHTQRKENGKKYNTKTKKKRELTTTMRARNNIKYRRQTKERTAGRKNALGVGLQKVW